MAATLAFARWPLRVEVTPGARLSESELRELWSFRLTIMRLKPHVSPQEDFEKFARSCREAASVLRVWERGGALGSMLVVALHEGHFEGERYRLLLMDYGFSAPRLRGHPVMLWGWIRMLLPLLRAPRGTRLLAGGIGYPTSAMTLERYFPPLWLYGAEDAPPLVRHVLEWLVTHEAGKDWDAERRCVSMPTVPPAPSEGWLARQRGRAAYARYLAQCPDWTRGQALPLLVGLSPRTVLGIIRNMPRRWLERRLRGRT